MFNTMRFGRAHINTTYKNYHKKHNNFHRQYTLYVRLRMYSNAIDFRDRSTKTENKKKKTKAAMKWKAIKRNYKQIICCCNGYLRYLSLCINNLDSRVCGSLQFSGFEKPTRKKKSTQNSQLHNTYKVNQYSDRQPKIGCMANESNEAFTVYGVNRTNKKKRAKKKKR